MAFVWQISVVGFPKLTLVEGVILSGNPVAYHGKKGRYDNLISILRTYVKKPYSNKKVTLVLGSVERKLETDKRGGFKLIIPESFEKAPHPEIFIKNEKLPLAMPAEYPVFFDASSQRAVISDIDDTILVSHSIHTLKRIKTLTLRLPGKRKVIPFTKKLLQQKEKEQWPVFYVSKSENNLFGLLASFIRFQSLPDGKICLTPYRNLRSLLSGKEYDFKYRIIRELIDFSDPEKLLLIGDDGQADMEIYTRIIKEFRSIITEVYIRKTKKRISKRKQNLMEQLLNTGVKVHYFE